MGEGGPLGFKMSLRLTCITVEDAKCGGCDDIRKLAGFCPIGGMKAIIQLGDMAFIADAAIEPGGFVVQVIPPGQVGFSGGFGKGERWTLDDLVRIRVLDAHHCTKGTMAMGRLQRL